MSIEDEVRREGEAEEAEAVPPQDKWKGLREWRGSIPADFREQYLSEWKESPVDAELRRLAAEYHDRREAYDRTVCLQRNKEGVAVPTNEYEMTMISRFAGKVRRELQEKAQGIGATRMQLHDAIVAESRRRRGQ